MLSLLLFFIYLGNNFFGIGQNKFFRAEIEDEEDENYNSRRRRSSRTSSRNKRKTTGKNHLQLLLLLVFNHLNLLLFHPLKFIKFYHLITLIFN